MAFRQRGGERKFRTTRPSGEDDEEEDAPVVRPQQQKQPPKKDVPSAKGPSPAPPALLRPTLAADVKRDGAKPAVGLSFVEDVEVADDSGFKPRKDKKDKERKSKFVRAPLPDLLAEASHTQRSTAGEYTAERLAELQKNAVSFSTAKLAVPASDGAGGAPGQQPLIKLSGSFKPAGAPKDDRFTIEPTALVPPEPKAEARDAQLPPPPGRPSQQHAAAAGAGPSGGDRVEADEDEGDDGIIPDEETILAAKAKRERLRQAHLAPDYIPLAGAGLAMGRLKLGGLAGTGAGTGAGEDAGGGDKDDEGSDAEADAEDQMRIRFDTGRQAGGRGVRDTKGYARTLGGDADEEAFAEEQLRKALQRQANPVRPGPSGRPEHGAGAAYGGGGSGARAVGVYGSGAASAPSLEGPYGFGFGGMAGSRTAAIRAAADSVVTSLQDALRRMQTSHKQVQLNLKRTGENLATSLQRIEDLERELQGAGERYLYVQQLRAYVADLCDCLRDKSAIAEALEDERLELMEHRAGAYRALTQALEAEMAGPAEAAVAAATTVLSRGGSEVAARLGAEAATRAAEGGLLGEDLPPELDEFGRDLSLGRRRELTERAKVRQRLLELEGQRLAAAVQGSPIQALDMEADPADEEAASYRQRYRQIVESCSTVFNDADEEFASVDAVRKRLEEWKHKFPKDYVSAYMHLSTPALFAPYVRLELLRWDPLYGGAGAAGGGGDAGQQQQTAAGAPAAHYEGFDQQHWYTSLFDYGLDSSAGPSAADDPDQDLVPQLVRKLVLPLALHWVERCWDVRSVGQTRAVAALASELLVYVPAEEERMVELLAVVRGSLEAAVDTHTVPAWPPAAVACCALARHVQFRRFRYSLRLLHCIAAFEGLLARGLLIGLALNRVVGGQLLAYCRAAGVSALGVSCVEAAAAALPAAWFQAGTPPEAVAFSEHMASMARVLEAGGGGVGPGERAALAGRLARAMAQVGDAERSRRLAAALGIRL